MHRLLILLLGIAITTASCSKNNVNNESLLYGTWVKGTNAGDTLWFMRKDDKNIMRSNQSFNPALPTYKEEEYSFSNAKLSWVLSPSSSAFSHIDSFAWVLQGKKFEVLGYQLFMFMSSTATKFTYVKIN